MLSEFNADKVIFCGCTNTPFFKFEIGETITVPETLVEAVLVDCEPPVFTIPTALLPPVFIVPVTSDACVIE